MTYFVKEPTKVLVQTLGSATFEHSHTLCKEKKENQETSRYTPPTVGYNRSGNLAKMAPFHVDFYVNIFTLCLMMNFL